MSWLITGATAATGLPPYCQPQTDFLRWLSDSLHTCVPTPLALVTTVLGNLSFVAWLFAQLPQIYKNYQVKSTAGLSFMFLAVWLVGDSTNLAGAILTRQASWQVLLASYYTLVDCTLVFQFAYYTHYLPWKRKSILPPDFRPDNGEGSSQPPSHPDRQRDERRSDPMSISNRQKAPRRTDQDHKSPFGSFRWSKEKRRTHVTAGTGTSYAASPKTVLLVSMLMLVLAQASPLPILSAERSAASGGRDRRERIGKVFSWISTISYLVSRFPQIIKNAQRKSTAGLAITLFIAAFFGNFFYSTSLLTNPLAWSSYPPHGYFGWADGHGSDRRTWVLLALPFWLGAAGVLTLDFTVFIQFLLYGGGAKPIKVIQVPDERGRTAWRSVSGYMRGWVPSPGPGGWRSRLPSRSRDSSRPSSSREESRPLLVGDSSEARPEGTLRPDSQFRPGSPLRPGSPSPLQAARARPGVNSVAGSPLAGSPLSRSYGAMQ